MTGRMEELLSRTRKREQKRAASEPPRDRPGHRGSSQIMTPKPQILEAQPHAAQLRVVKPHEAQIDDLLTAFRSHPRFLLTSHTRPDGDAIGSVLALPRCSTSSDARPTSYLPTRSPPPTSPSPTSAESAIPPSANDVDPDGNTPAILLECDGIARTGLLGLEDRTLINIDHHASGRPFGSVNWIDEHACAVAAMVYHIAVAANVNITPSMATCIYAGILSDTGSFTYSSTTADTFALVQRLAVCGANPSQIARDIYHSNPASKIRLLGIALSNLQCDNDLAWTWVTSQDMDRVGAVAEDCEGVRQLPHQHRRCGVRRLSTRGSRPRAVSPQHTQQGKD